MKKCPFNFYGETKRIKFYLNNFKVFIFYIILREKASKRNYEKDD